MTTSHSYKNYVQKKNSVKKTSQRSGQTDRKETTEILSSYELASIAQTSLFEQFGDNNPGFTLALDGTSPAVGLAVSIEEHSTELTSKIPSIGELARDFEKKIPIIQSFAQNEAFLGGWAPEQRLYSDITIVFPAQSLDLAIEFAIENGQDAIFDLESTSIVWERKDGKKAA